MNNYNRTQICSFPILYAKNSYIHYVHVCKCVSSEKRLRYYNENGRVNACDDLLYFVCYGFVFTLQTNGTQQTVWMCVIETR